MGKKTKYDFGTRMIVESPNHEGNRLLVIYNETDGTMLNYATREPLTGTINVIDTLDKKDDWWARK
jgi:hypothetical protein